MRKQNKISILTILIVLVYSLVSFAARYEVFKVEGNVMIKEGDKWMSLKVHEPLESASVIKLEENSRLGIKDDSNKAIYYGSDEGEYSVIKFIMNAKKGSQNKTSSIIKTMSNSVSSGTNRRKAVLGVTFRGTEGVDDTFNSVKDGSLGDLLAILISGKHPTVSESPYNIKGKLIVDADSVVSFSLEFLQIKEDTDSIQLCFVNVMRITDGEFPQFLFSSGIKGESLSIAEGEKLLVDWFPSIFDSNAKYLLVINNTPYKVETLQNIINSRYNKNINTGLPLDKQLMESTVWIVEMSPNESE